MDHKLAHRTHTRNNTAGELWLYCLLMLDHHHPLFCLIPRTSENTEGAIKKKTKDLRALRVILHLTAQERSVYTSVSKMDFIACLCDIWQSETCLLDWKSWGTQLGIACSAASKAPQKLSHNIISHQKKIKAMCVSSWLCVYVFLCVFVFVCVCVCVRAYHRTNKLTLNSCDLCS